MARSLADRSRGGEPGIAASVVGAVMDALVGCGMDRDALAVPALGEGEVVPGAAADRVLDGAAFALRDEALGLALARRIPIGGLGLIDYALSTSATVRDALSRVARHYGIATQRVKLSLVEDGRLGILAFERRTGVAHSRHWIEFSFAVLAQRIRQTAGREVAFDLVSFRHGPPGSRAAREAHDAFFGTAVVFSASADRLGFARALLDAPLRTAAASLAALLDEKMRAMGPPAPREAVDPSVVAARQAIAALLDSGDVRLEALARRLHVSRRTLQRDLGRAGTSHKELLDAIRRERALAMLAEGGATVAEIASRLAYSDPSAFFRAYRRWTGTSPRARR